MENEFNLNTFLNEIQDLQLAKELIKEIWIELGPYNNVLSENLMNKINKYMKFDDSE